MSELEARNRATAIRWFETVWNQGRQDSIRELWAEGGVAHVGGLPPVTRKELIEFHRLMLSAIPDLSVAVLDALASREIVILHWEMTGTHAGVLFGIPPTDRPVSETGMTKFVIRHGRITEGWDTWNLGAMLDRLARPSIDEVKRAHGLTNRQAEVADLIAGGLSAKGISRRLGISHNTARRDCQAVLRRLGLHSRRDVARAIGRIRVSVSDPVSTLVSKTAVR